MCISSYKPPKLTVLLFHCLLGRKHITGGGMNCFLEKSEKKNRQKNKKRTLVLIVPL